jgi:hypothetical protein
MKFGSGRITQVAATNDPVLMEFGYGPHGAGIPELESQKPQGIDNFNP